MNIITPENNIEFLQEQLRIAKLNDDPYAKEILLRKLLEFEPNKLKYKLDLAKSLIKQYNWIRNGKVKTSSNPFELLDEAEKLLIDVLKKDPGHLTAVKFLKVVDIILNRNLKLPKFEGAELDNPSDFHQSRLMLKRKRKKARKELLFNPDFEIKSLEPEDDFEENDFTSQVVISGSEPTTFVILYAQLMNLLNSGLEQRDLISKILYQMLEEQSLNKESRNLIYTMINKTKSNKPKNFPSLKGDAIRLSKRFR